MARQVKDRKGHFVCYERTNFQRESLRRIEMINKLITEYQEMNLDVTVRQVYYQLVQDNFIPNQPNEYGKLQGLIAKGRMAGLISWTAVEDRGRNLIGHRYYKSPAHAVLSTTHEYRIDKGADQDWKPEVHCEKQALEGVVGQICAQLDVDYFSCRGYNSLSEQWRAGQRFRTYLAKGQRPIVFYLGDHDPSGIDMGRKAQDRLTMFTGTPITFQRIGLNMSQIEEYGLPPNPAKDTDSRYDEYEAEFGSSSWELDALRPPQLQKLIEDAVNRVRDPVKWDKNLAIEVADKRVLEEIVDQLDGKITEEEEDDNPGFE